MKPSRRKRDDSKKLTKGEDIDNATRTRQQLLAEYACKGFPLGMPQSLASSLATTAYSLPLKPKEYGASSVAKRSVPRPASILESFSPIQTEKTGTSNISKETVVCGTGSCTAKVTQAPKPLVKVTKNAMQVKSMQTSKVRKNTNQGPSADPKLCSDAPDGTTMSLLEKKPTKILVRPSPFAMLTDGTLFGSESKKLYTPPRPEQIEQADLVPKLLEGKLNLFETIKKLKEIGSNVCSPTRDRSSNFGAAEPDAGTVYKPETIVTEDVVTCTRKKPPQGMLRKIVRPKASPTTTVRGEKDNKHGHDRSCILADGKSRRVYGVHQTPTETVIEHKGADVPSNSSETFHKADCTSEGNEGENGTNLFDCFPEISHQGKTTEIVQSAVHEKNITTWDQRLAKILPDEGRTSKLKPSLTVIPESVQICGSKCNGQNIVSTEPDSLKDISRKILGQVAVKSNPECLGGVNVYPSIRNAIQHLPTGSNQPFVCLEPLETPKDAVDGMSDALQGKGTPNGAGELGKSTKSLTTLEEEEALSYALKDVLQDESRLSPRSSPRLSLKNAKGDLAHGSPQAKKVSGDMTGVARDFIQDTQEYIGRKRSRFEQSVPKFISEVTKVSTRSCSPRCSPRSSPRAKKRPVLGSDVGRTQTEKNNNNAKTLPVILPVEPPRISRVVEMHPTFSKSHAQIDTYDNAKPIEKQKVLTAIQNGGNKYVITKELKMKEDPIVNNPEDICMERHLTEEVNSVSAKQCVNRGTLNHTRPEKVVSSESAKNTKTKGINYVDSYRSENVGVSTSQEGETLVTLASVQRDGDVDNIRFGHLERPNKNIAETVFSREHLPDQADKPFAGESPCKKEQEGICGSSSRNVLDSSERNIEKCSLKGKAVACELGNSVSASVHLYDSKTACVKLLDKGQSGDVQDKVGKDCLLQNEGGHLGNPTATSSLHNTPVPDNLSIKEHVEVESKRTQKNAELQKMPSVQVTLSRSCGPRSPKGGSEVKSASTSPTTGATTRSGRVVKMTAIAIEAGMRKEKDSFNFLRRTPNSPHESTPNISPAKPKPSSSLKKQINFDAPSLSPVQTVRTDTTPAQESKNKKEDVELDDPLARLIARVSDRITPSDLGLRDKGQDLDEVTDTSTSFCTEQDNISTSSGGDRNDSSRNVLSSSSSSEDSSEENSLPSRGESPTENPIICSEGTIHKGTESKEVSIVVEPGTSDNLPTSGQFPLESVPDEKSDARELAQTLHSPGKKPSEPEMPVSSMMYAARQRLALSLLKSAGETSSITPLLSPSTPLETIKTYHDEKDCARIPSGSDHAEQPSCSGQMVEIMSGGKEENANPQKEDKLCTKEIDPRLMEDHAIFEKLEKPCPTAQQKVGAFMSSELDDYLAKNKNLTLEKPATSLPQKFSIQPAPDKELPDVDEIEGVVFMSFSTGSSLHSHTGTQGKGRSRTVTANIPPPKSPDRMSDEAKARHSEKKYLTIEEVMEAGNPSELKHQGRKLHWRTQERLARSLSPGEIWKCGLNLKKRRRKKPALTKKKKGYGGMPRLELSLPIEQVAVPLQSNENEDGENEGKERWRQPRGAIYGRLSDGQFAPRGRVKYPSKPPKLINQSPKKKAIATLLQASPNKSSDNQAMLESRKLRCTRELPRRSSTICPSDPKPVKPTKARRRPDTSDVRLMILSLSQALEAVEALAPEFVHSPRHPKWKARPSSPRGPSTGVSPVQKSSSPCKEPGCRYGCVCHLCEPDFSRLPPLPEPMEGVRCEEEFCRLGCVCGSLGKGESKKQHCGIPECMFECICQKKAPRVCALRANSIMADIVRMESLEGDEDSIPLPGMDEDGSHVHKRPREARQKPSTLSKSKGECSTGTKHTADSVVAVKKAKFSESSGKKMPKKREQLGKKSTTLSKTFTPKDKTPMELPDIQDGNTEYGTSHPVTCASTSFENVDIKTEPDKPGSLGTQVSQDTGVRKSNRLKDRSGIGGIDMCKSLIYFDAENWVSGQEKSKRRKKDTQYPVYLLPRYKDTQEVATKGKDGRVQKQLVHTLHRGRVEKPEEEELEREQTLGELDLLDDENQDDDDNQSCARTNIYIPARWKHKIKEEEGMLLEIKEEKETIQDVIQIAPTDGEDELSDAGCHTGTMTAQGSAPPSVAPSASAFVSVTPSDNAINKVLPAPGPIMMQTAAKQPVPVSLGFGRPALNDLILAPVDEDMPKSDEPPKKVSVTCIPLQRPLRPMKTQMVLLQKKPNLKSGIPHEEKLREPTLLEVHSVVDWEPVRSQMLSKISASIGHIDGYPLLPLNVDVLGYRVEFLPKANQPNKIPLHLQEQLKAKEMYAIRILIRQSDCNTSISDVTGTIENVVYGNENDMVKIEKASVPTPDAVYESSSPPPPVSASQILPHATGISGLGNLRVQMLGLVTTSTGLAPAQVHAPESENIGQETRSTQPIEERPCDSATSRVPLEASKSSPRFTHHVLQGPGSVLRSHESYTNSKSVLGNETLELSKVPSGNVNVNKCQPGSDSSQSDIPSGYSSLICTSVKLATTSGKPHIHIPLSAFSSFSTSKAVVGTTSVVSTAQRHILDLGKKTIVTSPSECTVRSQDANPLTSPGDGTLGEQVVDTTINVVPSDETKTSYQDTDKINPNILTLPVDLTPLDGETEKSLDTSPLTSPGEGTPGEQVLHATINVLPSDETKMPCKDIDKINPNILTLPVALTPLDAETENTLNSPEEPHGDGPSLSVELAIPGAPPVRGTLQPIKTSSTPCRTLTTATTTAASSVTSSNSDTVTTVCHSGTALSIGNLVSPRASVDLDENAGSAEDVESGASLSARFSKGFIAEPMPDLGSPPLKPHLKNLVEKLVKQAAEFVEDDQTSVTTEKPVKKPAKRSRKKKSIDSDGNPMVESKPPTKKKKAKTIRELENMEKEDVEASVSPASTSVPESKMATPVSSSPMMVWSVPMTGSEVLKPGLPLLVKGPRGQLVPLSGGNTILTTQQGVHHKTVIPMVRGLTRLNKLPVVASSTSGTVSPGTTSIPKVISSPGASVTIPLSRIGIAPPFAGGPSLVQVPLSTISSGNLSKSTVHFGSGSVKVSPIRPGLLAVPMSPSGATKVSSSGTSSVSTKTLPLCSFPNLTTGSNKAVCVAIPASAIGTASVPIPGSDTVTGPVSLICPVPKAPSTESLQCPIFPKATEVSSGTTCSTLVSSSSSTLRPTDTWLGNSVGGEMITSTSPRTLCATGLREEKPVDQQVMTCSSLTSSGANVPTSAADIKGSKVAALKDPASCRSTPSPFSLPSTDPISTKPATDLFDELDRLVSKVVTDSVTSEDDAQSDCEDLSNVGSQKSEAIVCLNDEVEDSEPEKSSLVDFGGPSVQKSDIGSSVLKSLSGISRTEKCSLITSSEGQNDGILASVDENVIDNVKTLKFPSYDVGADPYVLQYSCSTSKSLDAVSVCSSPPVEQTDWQKSYSPEPTESILPAMVEQANSEGFSSLPAMVAQESILDSKTEHILPTMVEQAEDETAALQISEVSSVAHKPEVTPIDTEKINIDHDYYGGECEMLGTTSGKQIILSRLPSKKPPPAYFQVFKLKPEDEGNLPIEIAEWTPGKDSPLDHHNYVVNSQAASERNQSLKKMESTDSSDVDVDVGGSSSKGKDLDSETTFGLDSSDTESTIMKPRKRVRSVFEPHEDLEVDILSADDVVPSQFGRGRVTAAAKLRAFLGKSKSKSEHKLHLKRKRKQTHQERGTVIPQVLEFAEEVVVVEDGGSKYRRTFDSRETHMESSQVSISKSIDLETPQNKTSDDILWKQFRERQRRNDMQYKFESLRMALFPNEKLYPSKHSKQFLLDSAMESIASLKEKECHLKEEKDQLYRQRERLVARKKSLQEARKSKYAAMTVDEASGTITLIEEPKGLGVPVPESIDYQIPEEECGSLTYSVTVENESSDVGSSMVFGEEVSVDEEAGTITLLNESQMSAASVGESSDYQVTDEISGSHLCPLTIEDEPDEELVGSKVLGMEHVYSNDQYYIETQGSDLSFELGVNEEPITLSSDDEEDNSPNNYPSSSNSHDSPGIHILDVRSLAHPDLDHAC